MSRHLVRRRMAVLAAASLTALAGAVTVAPAASALLPINGGLVNSPEYCVAVYGDPSPCPPPDRPPRIDDPSCLRVDVEPLHCEYLP